MSEMMITPSLVRVKDSPPYSKELEGPVLLNSMARASYDPKTGSYAFTKKLASKADLDTSNVTAISDILSKESVSGVGVDQGRYYLHLGLYYL
jgi:fatty acid synthase subunit alpha, fungi type